MLGVLPGIVGSLQASEALKLCLGIGESLAGRLLLFDALVTEFSEVKLKKDPACPVCGESPTITEYVDYVEFCSGKANARMSKVRIPPMLREEVGGAREVPASGANVRELLDDLMSRFPALRAQIVRDDEIAPFVNVYVEGEDVRTLDGLDTPVEPGQTVILLPAMAGGSGLHSETPPALSSSSSATRLSSSCRTSRRSRPCACTRSSRDRTRPARSRIASRSR